jgi:hypothetical protein
MRTLIAFLVAAFATIAIAAAPYPVWVDAPNGLAKVNAPLTLANGTISLPAAGAATAGHVTTGAQTIAGAKTFSGNTAIGGTLAVTGASTLTGAVTHSTTSTLTGNVTMGGTLGVAGASTLASVGVTGAATVGTTLGVTGAATVGGTLGVTGLLSSPTEHTLSTWYFNAAAATGSCPATGTGCIGHRLPAQAFTVTGITGFASVASGGGAANTVITVTDGTNTCTVTIPCNSAPPAGTSAAGLVRVAGVNGAGTGCVYAANASLTYSVTTAGCTATQPTFKNLDLVGKWQ